MQINVQEGAGFCAGVQRAINLAENAALRHSTVYTLGALIHNKRVVDNLKEKGIVPVENIEDIPNYSIVVIRSHGVTSSVYDALKEKGCEIVDATCPSVKIIHDKVRKMDEKGYKIIIIGDANHPEIKGICGYCKEPLIFACEEEVFIPENHDKFFVVVQTTFDAKSYAFIENKMQFICRNLKKTVEFFNSICYTTNIRQNGAEEVAKKSDVVFVIGDKDSSNTNKLCDIAKKYCQNVYLISDVTDLKSVTNTNITMPGILAGASTPKELIMEVINIMEQQNNTVDVVVTDEVKTAVAEKAEAKKEPMTMEEALKSNKYGFKAYRAGMKVKARIVSIELAGVSVAVEGLGKNDSGFIDKSEMELDGSYEMNKYSVGDVIDAIIIEKTDAKMKSLNLSKKAFDEIKVADEAVKTILEGEEFSLACTQAIKGGLLGKIGTYTIFVPASQIRIGYVKNLEDYVGKKLRLRMLPAKEEAQEEGEDKPKHRPNPKRIVASQRIILEEEKQEREDSFWEVMQVNNIMKGKVKRFGYTKDGKPFGAFVSIMNFDCLAHISDLSWTKITDPAEVIEIGKTYDFVVLSADREKNKVSLGYKQLQKKPYEIAAEKYPVGTVIKGKVERIQKFGAFVTIEPGIDGLVHVSEIAHKWIEDANDALKVGDEVEAKIISFDDTKITLSMKALIEAPAVEEVQEEAAPAEGEEKASRTAKFNKRAAQATEAGKEKKERKGKRVEDDDEPHEYISSSSMGAKFAALFKDVDLNKFDNNEGDGE